MKLYSNLERWHEKVKAVPAPLRAKRLKELDGFYKSQGFLSKGGGEDSNGPFINVKLRPGLTTGDIAAFCEREDFAAVTLEAQDMAVLFGNSPIGLGAQRGLELEGTGGTGSLPSTELLEPGEIADTMQRVGWASFANTGPTSPETEAIVTADLINSGLMSQADADATDDWINGESRKEAAAQENARSGEWAIDEAYAAEWQ